MNAPVFDEIENSNNTGKIIPIYPLTFSLTQNTLRKIIENGLQKVQEQGGLPETLPDYILKEYKLENENKANYDIHFPKDFEDFKKARRRLVFEELLSTQLALLQLKNNNLTDKKGIKFNKNVKMSDVINTLPFKLTKAQLKVLQEIDENMESEKSMNRLLQGDVGSGKTIISIIAMVANYLSGYQSALMVPTEILATQHYETMKEILKDLNVNIALLTGSLPKNKKDFIHEELKLGKIDMVVGTHALIQEEVVYKNLGLVITDEQHRFGVLQRTSLQNKGITPDVLYMSATPIPRTYALTLYGDMDISTIRTLPKGRKPIKTYLKSYSEIKDVLKMMYEELLKNHQIYVIAPLIEESETLDLTTVNELKDKMNLAFGEKYNVGIIHGKLKQTEKDKIMEDFVNNKIQILISTTVIEVGVNVLNTTMMVIFDANRFGLSTLHQLRGRVGRSALESSCILISDYDSERLNVMTTTNDGFEISEEDFKIRGHGDLFGTKQSGDMTFKIADIKEDYKILLQAKKDSMEFLLNNKEEELKEKIINGIKEG